MTIVDHHQSHLSAPPETNLQDLTKYITKDEEYPAARGGFGEVWKCTYHMDQGRVKVRLRSFVHHVTKTQQVAVKALMVYSTDQVGEAKEKKIKVPDSIKVCIDYLYQTLPLYRGYSANSKYVLYSIIEIFCLFMVGHPALAHLSRLSVLGQRTET